MTSTRNTVEEFEDPQSTPRTKTVLTGLAIVLVVGSLIAFVAIRSRRMNAGQAATALQESLARQDAKKLAKYIDMQELYGFSISEAQAADVIKTHVFPYCTISPLGVRAKDPDSLHSEITVELNGKLGNGYSFQSDISSSGIGTKVPGLLKHLLTAAAFGSYSGKLPHSTVKENDAYVLLPYFKAHQASLSALGITAFYDYENYNSASIAKLIPSYEQELKHRAKQGK